MASESSTPICNCEADRTGPSPEDHAYDCPQADDNMLLHETRIALAGILKLIEDGVLVRNTADDGDPAKYLNQAIHLARVLKNAQEIL